MNVSGVKGTFIHSGKFLWNSGLASGAAYVLDSDLRLLINRINLKRGFIPQGEEPWYQDVSSAIRHGLHARICGKKSLIREIRMITIALGLKFNDLFIPLR